jgi:hypothetical protein
MRACVHACVCMCVCVCVCVCVRARVRACVRVRVSGAALLRLCQASHGPTGPARPASAGPPAPAHRAPHGPSGRPTHPWAAQRASWVMLRAQVLERVCREVQAQAALYQESVRDEAELADTTGVELGQVCNCVRVCVCLRVRVMSASCAYGKCATVG